MSSIAWTLPRSTGFPASLYALGRRCRSHASRCARSGPARQAPARGAALRASSRLTVDGGTPEPGRDLPHRQARTRQPGDLVAFLPAQVTLFTGNSYSQAGTPRPSCGAARA